METSDALDVAAGAEVVVGAGAAGVFVSDAGGAVFTGGVLVAAVEPWVSVAVGPVTPLLDGAFFPGAFVGSVAAEPVVVWAGGAVVTGAVDMAEPVAAVDSVVVPVVSVTGAVVVVATVAVVSLLVVFAVSDGLQPTANSNRTEVHKVMVVFIRYLLT